MSKNTHNFFCTRCNATLCEDCKSIALEFAELHHLKNLYLQNAEIQARKQEQEIERLRREVQFLRDTINLGFEPLARTWFNKIEAEALYKRVLAHNEHRRKMDEIDELLKGNKRIDPQKLADLFK